MKKFVTLGVCLLLAGALALSWFLFGRRLLGWYYGSGAEDARAAGQLMEAARLLESELSLNPRDEELRLRAAALYVEAGNYSRAEYLLYTGLRESGPSEALYRALCALYVEQDKLYDAVTLLDGIADSAALADLASLRPPAPLFSHPSGLYEESITVSLSAPGDCVVYVTWREDVPSTAADRYASPVTLQAGITRARAVSVGPNGLVSTWSDAQYRLENIVEPLSFADPAVEALVRAAAGKPSGLLYSNDVWSIRELTASAPAAYRTLADLAFCTGLRRLSLTGDGQTACDLSVLPLLGGLADLTLTGFGIDSVDLSFIGEMTWLEALDLSENRLSALDALSGLTGLTELRLASNNLLELDALAGLTELRLLDLSQGAVQDLRPLAGLTKLEELRLRENRITSLAGLERLSRLRLLDAGRNYLDDPGGLDGLSALEELLLDGNALEALPSLEWLSRLRRLDVSRNALTSLAFAEGLGALSELSASENGLSSLAGAEKLTALVTADFSRNALTSVSELKGLPLLETLRVENNAVKSLLPLKSCAALKTIYAFGNPLTDPIDAFANTGITVHRG